MNPISVGICEKWGIFHYLPAKERSWHAASRSDVLWRLASQRVLNFREKPLHLSYLMAFRRKASRLTMGGSGQASAGLKHASRKQTPALGQKLIANGRRNGRDCG